MERAARTDGKTMNIAIKTLGAISAAFLISGPALAEIYSPAGTWVTGPKDSRYEVTLCGDGDDMCGKLVWLQSPSKELSPYLNKLVLDTAKRIGNQTWRAGRYRGPQGARHHYPRRSQYARHQSVQWRHLRPVSALPRVTTATAKRSPFATGAAAPLRPAGSRGRSPRRRCSRSRSAARPGSPRRRALRTGSLQRG